MRAGFFSVLTLALCLPAAGATFGTVVVIGGHASDMKSHDVLLFPTLIVPIVSGRSLRGNRPLRQGSGRAAQKRSWRSGPGGPVLEVQKWSVKMALPDRRGTISANWPPLAFAPL